MKIAVWGASTNGPGWNQRLHVQASRQGCSSSPVACVDSLRPVAASGLKVFISILLDSRSAQYAREYGKLSRNNPWIAEISYDDFVAQYEKLAKAAGPFAAEQSLKNAVQELKSANPNLKFGITLYEFELDSPYLEDRRFPPDLRARVDYIHFYIAYRKNAPLFQQYLKSIKQKFPRARIIGGIYPYDRRDYLPCSPTEKKCDLQQETSLFVQGAQLEARMLKNGQLDWLEIAPGYFGRETDIPDWKTDPRSCLPERIPACVENTSALHRILFEILQTTAATK